MPFTDSQYFTSFLLGYSFFFDPPHVFQLGEFFFDHRYSFVHFFLIKTF